MPIWLWKAGAERRPPFHHWSYCWRETAPTLPSRSSRWVIASPSKLIPRVTSGGMFGFIGSLNGGRKMRAG